ncbi:MAG: type II secretion system protein [Planctomycetota bacterium]
MDIKNVRGRRWGFTLIELLVVIAIIALLVSILLPSLARAKRLAQTLKCNTHLKALGTASHIFAAENGGWVPRNDADGLARVAVEKRPPVGTFWPVCFEPYLTDDIQQQELEDGRDAVAQWIFANDFFRCPGLEAAGEERGLDYAVNNIDWDYYHDHKFDDKPYRYPPKENAVAVLSKIPVPPSDLLYLAECSRRMSIGFADLQSDNHLTFNRYGEPKGARMIKAHDMRHDGSTNFLAFDGHVETREMIPRNFPMSLYVPNHEPMPSN